MLKFFIRDEYVNKKKEFEHVYQFLNTNFKYDILMPVQRDTKKPLYGHKNSKWTWDEFNQVCLSYVSTVDYGIILNKLCVVDVDDKNIAIELEKQFPILLSVPMENTLRGRHYLFKRPSVADDCGYFDGPNQKHKGIDFKSIYKNGTGGFIVVAPSSNKTWIRHLDIDRIVEMPLDLLHHIAKPMFTTFRKRQFDFIDGSKVMDDKFMSYMEYFIPFTENDIITDVIPVPCSLKNYEDIIKLLEHTEIDDFSYTRFQELLTDADKLGLATKKINGIKRYNVYSLDLKNICPDMWLAAKLEKRWCEDGGKNDNILKNVSHKMANTLHYKNLELGDNQQLLDMGNNYQNAKSLLYKNPKKNVQVALPEQLIKIMKQYPNNLILAGGAVVGAVARYIQNGSDFDMFFVGVDESTATSMLVQIISNLYNKCSVIYSKRAVTLIFKERYCPRHSVTHRCKSFYGCSSSCGKSTCGDEEDFLYETTVIQFILRLHDNIAQVLLSFDIAPCKVAAFYNDEEELVLKCAPSWIPAMRHLAFAVETEGWSTTSAVRVFKYFIKGFQTFLPGIIRSPEYMKTNVSSSNRGIATLFNIEELYKSTYRDDEILDIYGGQTSDYMEQHKNTQRFTQIIYWLYNWFKKTSVKTSFNWSICDPKTYCKARFQPEDIDFDSVFYMKKMIDSAFSQKC